MHADYLDISSLKVDEEYRRIAYATNYRIGRARNETSFYTFSLKDCNARTVQARLFDIENQQESLFVAEELKGSPVLVSFRVQDYDGSISLVISNIERYEGEFELEKFIGKVENAEENLEYVKDKINELYGEEQFSMNKNYIRESVPNIMNGTMGGYTKLLHMAINYVYSFKDLDGINESDLGYVFHVCQGRYFRYLKQASETKIPIKYDKAKSLAELFNKVEGKKCEYLIMDCMYSLCGIDKPESIYSHIIYNAFRQAEIMLARLDIYNSMLIGARKEIGGDEVLVKY